METKAAAGQLVYEDFVPSHKVVKEEGTDTLIVELSEFKKEEISIYFENFDNLRIRGEHPLADNRWSRFHKDFQLDGCNEIRSRFENGRLDVKMLPSAKAAIKIKETTVKDQSIQTQQPKTPKPSTGKDDMIVPKKQDVKEVKLIDPRKDEEKVGEKGKDQTEEKKDNEKLKVLESGLGFSKPMQLLVNIIVGIVILVVMALYMTSRN
ncbi:uncharacterized protein [Elaeis guineensis]|uniref:Inactive protein RESTRICTED TEV MOVEMENT 2 n=1 Tax=Elaeis guineensis var. tenera TaxID=51953 RepID=A0A6I9QZB4_ELAGV|nr:inactive protein RESTRICTED TEV MOVEMENT 2 [Elaeis guineensis]